jgi:hypothetical protein
MNSVGSNEPDNLSAIYIAFWQTRVTHLPNTLCINFVSSRGYKPLVGRISVVTDSFNEALLTFLSRMDNYE